MLTMQGRTLLKNVELLQRKWTADRPHPPYSPVLAPSDFFLFPYVKKCLKGMVFPSYEELLDAIGEVAAGIESETLTAMFEH
jgi:hypothetical protein